MASPLGETGKPTKSVSVPPRRERSLPVTKARHMVKRIGNLWETLVSEENLRKAYENARKGKNRRPDVWKVDADPD